MKQFLKQVLAVVVGFSLIASFFAFLFIGVLASSSKPVVVKENSILKLNLNYVISEQDNVEDFDLINGQLSLQESIGLEHLIQSIQSAKKDDKIKGIYLELGANPNSFATIDVLRRALLDFKSSGKFIKAYGEYVTQKSYYLATVADKIFLNPEGIIEMRGIGTELTFFKKFLDNIDAEVEVFKVGTFKSAIEPFIREEMSEANREQLEFLLQGIKDDFINNISQARNIAPTELNNYINRLSFSSIDSSVNIGLIDEAKYYDEVLDDLVAHVGLENEKDLNFISINKYTSTLKKDISKSKNEIAVVYAQGDIVSNKQPNALSSEEYAEIISKLRKDDDIKAIVLRVNSPGGSALASEVIWRELEKAKESKKVIVSMGSLAASGGYYISCHADYIFAEENTITGSIGVFGMVPNIESFLENKIGVSFDRVNLNEHATMNGVTNKLSPFEKSIIQKGVEKVYDTFTKRVATGRGMSQEQVDKIGQGRVWTGEQAKEIGLVDELGGLQDAISYTKDLLELDEYRLKEFPRKKLPIEQIMEQMGVENIKQSILKKELGDLYIHFQETQKIRSNFNTIQAKMPYHIEIK